MPLFSLLFLTYYVTHTKLLCDQELQVEADARTFRGRAGQGVRGGREEDRRPGGEGDGGGAEGVGQIRATWNRPPSPGSG